MHKQIQLQRSASAIVMRIWGFCNCADNIITNNKDICTVAQIEFRLGMRVRQQQGFNISCCEQGRTAGEVMINTLKLAVIDTD